MPSLSFNILAITLPPWLANNLVPIIATAIIVLGLGIFGIPDLLRFSFKRVWAISSVCYQESIRRKVLWIIPVAIIGLVVVVQLQLPIDEQDAIRQTTKFCLFATGLVAVISTIILACTNLPREIENRVIFTVVTKPTTRLEIVLGKITGFARMSATILLIMGVFSYGYLRFRAYALEGDLRERLRLNQVESISRPTFQHYVDAGLLNAKRLAVPGLMNIYGQVPDFSSKRRYPSADGMVLVPFHLPVDDMWAVADPDDTQHPGLPGMRIHVRVGFDPVTPSTKPTANGKPAGSAGPPKLSVMLLDNNANNIMGGDIKGSPALIPAADGSQEVTFDVPSSYAALVAKPPFLFVVLSGLGDGKMWVEPDAENPPVWLEVPVQSQPQAIKVKPSDPLNKELPGHFVYAGREGVSGQQVKGDPTGNGQVCVYDFRGLKIYSAASANVPLEFRVGVEKSGEVGDEDTLTQATLVVVNSKTGKASAPISVQPENNRPFYASVPAECLAGGDFSVIVHCLSPEQWLNVKRDSLLIVEADESFAFNLFKSSVVLWLLSILVTTIAIFCSTFLSWPIAVVLTLVILLGRWGVNQLGDAATAGIGRQIATDFQLRDPTASTFVAGGVEDLNKAMKTVASVLPDIEQFAVTDDIDKGISIPGHTLAESAFVLVLFGLPLSVLSFVIFKNKEVAP
jgi:ABC-type transport system involved in multi-copper enzyme maturation permease subunit